MYTTNPHERSASNGRASCLPSDHRAPTERPPSELTRQSLGGRSAIARWALVGISGVIFVADITLFWHWVCIMWALDYSHDYVNWSFERITLVVILMQAFWMAGLGQNVNNYFNPMCNISGKTRMMTKMIAVCEHIPRNVSSHNYWIMCIGIWQPDRKRIFIGPSTSVICSSNLSLCARDICFLFTLCTYNVQAWGLIPTKIYTSIAINQLFTRWVTQMFFLHICD